MPSEWLDQISQPLTVPYWSVVVVACLASIAIADRVAIPALRWFLQRRANRNVDKLNTRLKLRIQQFKLTRRKVLIDRLINDPEVLTAIEGHAHETGGSREASLLKAKQYAREIVPTFSAYAYFKFGTRIARKLSQALYRVRLGYINEGALSAVPPNASVVFVINHRSNMDYILVTYVAATSSALSYAVGEWAQVFGLRALISSMGAYFIRRNSGDPLYRRVLARYVDMATKAGVVQAVFPEGGLSRDGRLQPPKLGILSYIVTDFDPRGARDIVFIPVGLNYDRVLEDRVLLGAANTKPGETPRFKFNLGSFLGTMAKNTWLRLTGRWHRYGYACVSFGNPISLKQYLQPRSQDFRTMTHDARHTEINALGQQLIEAVGHVIPALPVPLIATAILAANGAAMTHFELKGRVFDLMTALEQRGCYVHVPRRDREYAIDFGVRMLLERRLITRRDDLYAADTDHLAVLGYYANSIAHLVDATPAQPMAMLAPAVG